MEVHLQKSTYTDSSDAESVSGFSTFLVAHIQEMKDRISQIEYIFCSKLYPEFQMNNQNFQKIYSAREAAEEAYKQKEKDLLLQIKKLQYQNQQVLEDNRLLKLEKEQLINIENKSCNRFRELQEELNQKTLEGNERREIQQNLQKPDKTKQELEEENKMLLKKKKKLELEIEAQREDQMKKSKEVDDMMELQNKLLLINQSNTSLISQKEKQLNEYEEKTNGLTHKIEKLESKVNKLLSELREKTEEVEKGKELQGNLLKKIEFQAAEIMDNEQLSNKYGKENRLLASKVTGLINRTDELQKELGQRTSELEEVRKMYDQLLRQNDSLNIEIVMRGQALEEYQEEKKRLLDKHKGLEEKVDKLQQSLSEKMRETSEDTELHQKLLQQIEAKDSELRSERKKRKNLKSMYNYLLKKFNLTEETMLPLEGENEVTRQNQTPAPLYDIQRNTLKASDPTCDITKLVDDQEVLENKKEVVPGQRISPDSPMTSRILIAPKYHLSSSKPSPSAGVKRPHSYWRDTRSHQSRVGPDPHDDFLDTPLENIRDNLGKAVKEVRPYIPKPSAVNMCLNDSDDQTQDIKVDASPRPNKLHKSPPRAGTSGFKYVEPVRKKAERENLKGIECKQCRKFYDAVLPGAGDTDKQNIRCEHQDGVSRHRYRYAPPSTPEGFWNIGFESDM